MDFLGDLVSQQAQELPRIILRLTMVQHCRLHVHLHFRQTRVIPILEEYFFEAATDLLLQHDALLCLQLTCEEYSQILYKFAGFEVEHALEHGGVFGRTHGQGGIFEVTFVYLVDEFLVRNLIFFANG